MVVTDKNRRENLLRRRLSMDPIVYVLRKIDGDYAWLENVDHPEREPVFIARALLPDTVFEGARLLFENFEYTQL